MPVAFVLLNVEIGKIDEVLDEVLKIDEVREAYSVAGPYAIVAKVEVDRFEKLAKVIPEKFQNIKGITRSMTLLAFGIGGEFRTEACEPAKSLAQKSAMKELYELCRACRQLKRCSFGARVITFGF
jgi:triphosphoribosyl-dephospho-CoA synthetase